MKWNGMSVPSNSSQFWEELKIELLKEIGGMSFLF